MVQLKLKYRSEKFLLNDLPAVKILPKAEVLALGNVFGKRLIGTGPYRFIKEDLNEIRLESVRGRTRFIKFKIVRDDFTRYQKLMKGELDLAHAELPPGRIKEFEARPEEFQVLRYHGLTTAYILINLKDPLLQDRRVREALARAVNREEIIRYKLAGLARPATTILTPENPYFNPALRNPGMGSRGSRAPDRGTRPPGASAHPEDLE
ncbi:MAG: hypothetical protein HC902_02810 [Calothrix sp. SM1_5_4]|nr:hypothetical protein [Calothrix sp. SM1_5_4]